MGVDMEAPNRNRRTQKKKQGQAQCQPPRPGPIRAAGHAQKQQQPDRIEELPVPEKTEEPRDVPVFPVMSANFRGGTQWAAAGI
jgi:hypothetical protein